MTNAEIFTTAHVIAKTIRANFDTYRGAFSAALKKVYASLRAEKAAPVSIESKLIALGFKVWEKGDKRRIYVNIQDFEKVTQFKVGYRNRFEYKGYRLSPKLMNDLCRVSLYFDCVENKWFCARWQEAAGRWAYATEACANNEGTDLNPEHYSLGDSICDMIKPEFVA